MKRHGIFITFLLAVFPLSVWSQTAGDLNEGSRLVHDPVNNVYSFLWWGHEGRTYFMQRSDDLVAWNYFPEIKSGAGAVVQYNFTTSGDRIFTRLQHTDLPTSDPDNDDFDSDGISNLDEITMAPVPGNPLDASSHDGDSMPDDWENFYGLDSTVDNGSADEEPDGLINADEFTWRTDPNDGDTDDDGLKDGLDIVGQQNPLLRDHPDVELMLF